jgi:hypothetical protein
MRAAIYSALGLLLEVSIEWLVRLTGRRIPKSEAPWLNCVIGKPGVIGTGVYQRIAEEERLKLSQPPDAGLIPDFEVLRGRLSIPIKSTRASFTSTSIPHL